MPGVNSLTPFWNSELTISGYEEDQFLSLLWTVKSIVKDTILIVLARGRPGFLFILAE